MNKLLPLLLLLTACHTQHEQLLKDLKSPQVTDVRAEDLSEKYGMLGYGFSYEYIMVFGWLEVELSNTENCSENFDMTMREPSDIAKFIGSWCSIETQIFTDEKDGEQYYATTAICNDEKRVGLLVFPQNHNRDFVEASLVYKNLAKDHECTYDVIMKSDIMLQGS